MNWIVSGFIPIIIYSYTSTEAHEEKGTILTENGFNLWTELSQDILVES